MQKTYLWLLTTALLATSVAGFGQVKPVSLGTTSGLLQQLRQQVSATRQQGTTRVQLKIDAATVLSAKVNYRQTIGNASEYLAGEIDQVPGSSFFIQAEGNVLKGNIVLRSSKKAYVYYSDATGSAYVKEEDINKVVCTDFPQAPVAARNAPAANQAARIADLQSYPAGIGCVLLDFDGQYVAGTLWNGGNPINAAAAALSDAEQLEAYDLISEDYRPFRLNVTTSEAVYNTYPANRRMRVIFTPTNTAAPGAGGVAYVGSFTWGNETPCWVFQGGGKFSGDAGAHEIGHTLGLGHDGRTNPQEAYYGGQGNWAPIMGVGYGKPVSQWSKGEYANANNKQDDLAIIAGSSNGFGYRADDYGAALSTAGKLIINASGSVTNSGVIEQTGDLDLLSFTTTGGNVNLTVNPAARHGDLDIMAIIYNSSGAVVTYTAPDGLSAGINTTLAAGTYYLGVTGTGSGDPVTNGYSNYASLGTYSVSGTVAGAQGTTAATFYKDCNYGGTAVGLPPGSYTLTQLQGYGILNDDISSLKVSAGYQVVLYWDDNFGGSTLTVGSDNSCLVAAGWNDKASSLKIVAAAASGTLIQAENYSTMSGVQTETTTDTDGGLSVGYIETGDWMAYTSISFPVSGSYLVEYRVASESGGGQLSLDLNGGSTILGYLNIPSTGGWQSWTTISQTVTVSAGTYNLGIYAQAGGWNLNWIRVTPVGTSAAAADKSTIQSSAIVGNQTGFVLYPNPVASQLRIRTGANLSGGIITIYDVQGRPVMTVKGSTGAINVSSLSPGIYTLEFSSKDKKIIRQFIK